ncbi:uncharacterized protein [Struthio camelus]|uniref:uncharacterized protein isoform X2 n=2 Tax=Struthio camelus TaxID=8801 RepID=UPI003603E6CF
MGYREVGRAACLGCSPRMRVSLPPAAPPPAARAGCSSPSGAAFRALPRRCLMLLSPKVHSLPVCWQPRRMYEAAGNEQEVLLLCLEEEREQRRMRKRVRISPSRWSRSGTAGAPAETLPAASARGCRVLPQPWPALTGFPQGFRSRSLHLGTVRKEELGGLLPELLCSLLPPYLRNVVFNLPHKAACSRHAIPQVACCIHELPRNLQAVGEAAVSALSWMLLQSERTA